MNSVIETILSHRSIRKFTTQEIASEHLESIIQSGIAASSSSLLQAVSVIRVTDNAKRQKLAELAGNQTYVHTAAEFLVFCIDFNRHKNICSDSKLDFTELTLIGAIDAGIMAQNCILAAESLSLGGVYIGGLRNNAQQVDKLLELPMHCAVLFGLCLGHPDQSPELKPRLPAEIILHENKYQKLDMDGVKQYDDTMLEYYALRSTNTKQQSWSEQMQSKLSKESRPHIKGYLADKGLATK
ncbi:oxygen-insensitive NADPH nitroreductase [Vibrio marisflavi]|uniref:NADPH-flavin oxidoreductase n=1 Tax=Vibrio marisflavi CECT 7928 TaxID=634439 RepID=A0ABM9A0J0_9VIBR|nr:oxygen-insensitive NADPH nitroreductase [Vibrio marisflavi]CAH0536413.1 NADPH-flavin oxidoreductase [Vibrio marisflavi CECT 7928]